MTREYTGKITTVSWEDGTKLLDYNCVGCECQEHERPAPPAGLYVTIRLDNDEAPIGLWDTTIQIEESKLNAIERL